MTPETQNTPKKPYAEPKLLVYGDIRQITQSNMGKAEDNAAMGNMMTG